MLFMGTKNSTQRANPSKIGKTYDLHLLIVCWTHLYLIVMMMRHIFFTYQ